MENNSNNVSLIDRFTDFSVKIANMTYLQVLKDSFTTVMPMFILAGFGVLLNNVLFPIFAEGETLAQLQTIGNLIENATLNIAGILVAPMIAYYLSKARNFENSMPAIIVAIGSFFITLPLTIDATLAGSEELATVSGVVSYDSIGTNGMFLGIIVGLFATEVFIKLSQIEKFQINLGEGVPPTVSKSFAALIPIVLTVFTVTLISAALIVFWETTILDMVITLVQAPLQNIGGSLLGFIIIFSTGNFLFSLGIHHSVINNSILQPIMLVNINQNMAAVSAGETPPNILNESFRSIYATIGGTGSTFGLLIAIFIFIKYKPYKQVAGLASGPGLFNINEPIIFGLPVVFNIPMMIAFVLAPIIGTLIGYYATFFGIIEPFSVLVPWTTPPLVNSFLASGGDLMAVVVQLVIIAVQVLFYIPFLRVSARVAQRQAEELQVEQNTENG